MSAAYPHPAAWPDERLLRECRVERTRRSGPGGQHRNRVETAIVLHHPSSGLRAEAAERRSQNANQREALRRLRRKLAIELRTGGAATASPSLLWRSRIRQRRLMVNPEHDDYPSLLAEALDNLEHFEHDLGCAAAALGVTASQILKLLRAEPRALAELNRRRVERELRPLR